MEQGTLGLLHHIEIYVSDLKRSAEFWGWFLTLLGYTPFQEWDCGRSWKLGPTYIVLVQTQDKYLDIPYHRCRVGLNHLAFYAKSHHQIKDITEELRNKGMTILYEDKHLYTIGKDHNVVYFEDPDRIKVELVSLK